MGKLIDLTGQRFGRLVVLRQVESYRFPDGTGTCSRWRCRCDCGRVIETYGYALRHGLTQSCGCLRSDLCRERAAYMRSYIGSHV